MAEENKEEVKPEEKPEEKPQKSVLEETKEAIAELKKEREEMGKVRDELQQLRSDQLLSGTAGGRVEPEPPKEETDEEYSEKFHNGEVNPFKDDGAK